MLRLCFLGFRVSPESSKFPVLFRPMTRCMASFARLLVAAAASRCDFQRVPAAAGREPCSRYKACFQGVGFGLPLVFWRSNSGFRCDVWRHCGETPNSKTTPQQGPLFVLGAEDSLTKGFAKIHNEPLLITDTAWSRANASQKAFRQIFGRLPVQLTRNLEFQSRVGSKPEAINSTFGAWVDSLAQGDVPYLFEFCHHALCEEMESAYGVPELLQESSMRMYLSAGKVAKGVAFHQHRQTWGLLLAGRKVWYVAPPLQLSVPPFRHKEEAELEGISSLQRCEQEEGEVVYLPRDWWHATFNKADWNLAIGGQGQIAGSAFQANRGELDAKAVKKMSKMEFWPRGLGLGYFLFEVVGLCVFMR